VGAFLRSPAAGDPEPIGLLDPDMGLVSMVPTWRELLTVLGKDERVRESDSGCKLIKALGINK
jgi:hypothetical protein